MHIYIKIRCKKEKSKTINYKFKNHLCPLLREHHNRRVQMAFLVSVSVKIEIKSVICILFGLLEGFSVLFNDVRDISVFIILY